MELEVTKRIIRDPDTGNIVTTFELEGSEYDHAELKHLTDPEDRMILRAVRNDGEEETYPFDRLDIQFLGLEYKDGDRRDMPDDLLDALATDFYCVVPDVDSDGL